MHEKFLTMNKKVVFLFFGDSKGRKYFTTNKFHMKVSNGDFFPNYSITLLDTIVPLQLLVTTGQCKHVAVISSNIFIAKVRVALYCLRGRDLLENKGSIEVNKGLDPC